MIQQKRLKKTYVSSLKYEIEVNMVWKCVNAKISTWNGQNILFSHTSLLFYNAEDPFDRRQI